MQIVSQILQDPARRARLGELLGQAVACKKRIAEHKGAIDHLRTSAKHDIGLNPKDFNAEVSKYCKK